MRPIGLVLLAFACGGEPEGDSFPDALPEHYICDPLDGNRCEFGEKCTSVIDDGEVTIACVPLDGGGFQTGAPCTVSTDTAGLTYDDCAPYNICLDAICRQLCPPSAISPCQGDFECVDHANLFPPWDDVGACEPPE